MNSSKVQGYIKEAVIVGVVMPAGIACVGVLVSAGMMAAPFRFLLKKAGR
jgi:hypothetical protein